MKSFFDCSFSIVILTTILYSDSKIAAGIGATFENIREDLNISRKSKSFTGGVLSLMQTLGSSIPHHIRLLYCPENQEELAEISSRLSGDLIGLMSQSYEGPDTNLVPVLTPFPDERAVYLFTLCSTWKIVEIFQKMNNQSLDSHKVRWLLVVEGDEEITQFIYELETLVNEGTQVTILDKKSNHVYDVLWESVDAQGNINFFYGGNWDLGDRSVMDRMINHLAPDEHRGLHYDLSGRRMTVAAKQLPGYFVFGEVYPDGSVEPKSGVEVEMLKCMKTTFNITYRVVTDKVYGGLQPDGSVNGLIGMIKRREVSFGISALGVTEERNQLLDLTAHYGGASLQLVSKALRPRSRNLAALYPFTYEVWTAIAVSVLSMGCCIFVLSLLLRLSGFKSAEESGLGSHLFNVYRSIVVQGYQLNDQYWATRYLLFAWYSFCLIISASYSGMLTAVLALPSFETPIDYLHDLPRAVRNGYSVGVMEGTTIEYYFRSATEGILKRTWELFNHEDPEESFVDSHRLGMDRVLERKFVYIVPDVAAEVTTIGCDSRKYYYGRDKFLRIEIAMACPRGAPFLERLSILVLRIVEVGLKKHWRKQELRKLELSSDVFNCEETSANLQPFSLVHLQAAFAVMGLGFLAAGITFLSENIFHFGFYHQETSPVIKDIISILL